MIPSKRMKIFYLYLIKYMIILGFIIQCIEPAFAATKKRVHVTKPPKQTAVNITHLEEESAISTGNKYNYKMFIIALAVLVILSLPGAAVWFLYYRLKKKYGINDVEKATEEPQAKPSISGITTWFRLLYGKLREKNPVSGITAWLRLLYGKLRKKKPIYDEEKAIEKSQPKPTTSKTTLRSKGKKKKKKTKKKKAPVNKSVEEATVTPLTNQCTEEPVQSDQSPQALVQIAHSMPKENVGVTNVTEQQHTVPRGELSKEHTVESAKEICSKVRYKRVIILTWTEEIADDETDEVSTYQIKECQKEISVALKPDMRQATEPQKEQPSTTSTTKPKTIPAGLKASKKQTVTQEATDVKHKAENLTKDNLPVFPKRQGLPKPSWTSQMLKNMMVRHLGTEKDVDPEVLWKSVLRGTGKRTGPEINEKLSAIPKPSLEKQMLNKELKEHFQKHPELGSKCAILTGVGTSDELLLNPEVIPILPNPTLTRTYKPPKEKSFVTREKLRPIIDEMQARSLRQLSEKANTSQTAEKDEPQEDRQNRIERSPSLTFHEIIDTFNKQERKE